MNNLADDGPCELYRQPTQARAARVSIQVIEPTLVDEAGHCAARFLDLLAAAPDLRFILWADRRVNAALFATTSVQVRPYFFRRLRRPQALWLYWRLLHEPGPIYVPTAAYFDLRAFDITAGGAIPQNKAMLYFHKFNVPPQRRAKLCDLALRQPALRIFATTEEIAAEFRTAGWSDVRVALPEPVSLRTRYRGNFRHLLSAGAARNDKGFEHVVALAEALAAHNKPDAPRLVVQASGDHYGRHDMATRAQLARLSRLSDAGIEVIRKSLPLDQYARLFEGSICLQPYRPQDYVDKVSGITLDALRSGAPIITSAGTWMARIVAHTGAGEIIVDLRPESILAVTRRISADYSQYQKRALAAYDRLSDESGLAPLVAALRACALAPLGVTPT